MGGDAQGTAAVGSAARRSEVGASGGAQECAGEIVENGSAHPCRRGGTGQRVAGDKEGQAEGVDAAENGTAPADRPVQFSTSAGSQCRDFGFDHYVVYDFEATCDHPSQVAPQEIIEFSCVVIDAKTLEIRPDGYQKYLRPTVNPCLTSFCQQLTGIKQEQVDAGESLMAVLEDHEHWLESKGILAEGKAFVPCTWTNWDMGEQLELECWWRHILKPVYFDRWINLKKLFAQQYRSWLSLKQSVALLKLNWEGRNHCGMDDARNTARLAVKMIQDGVEMKVTGCVSSFQARHVPSVGDWTMPPTKKRKLMDACVQTDGGPGETPAPLSANETGQAGCLEVSQSGRGPSPDARPSSREPVKQSPVCTTGVKDLHSAGDVLLGLLKRSGAALGASQSQGKQVVASKTLEPANRPGRPTGGVSPHPMTKHQQRSRLQSAGGAAVPASGVNKDGERPGMFGTGVGPQVLPVDAASSQGVGLPAEGAESLNDRMNRILQSLKARGKG
ncbi:unnamed protein product [Ostreobium quekettii]|uniref:Exonuclease domain-containing protein n=1 Tax=Ostreobium quekettii TaxID=121088 RepID=A0A8S1ISE4_9CHLO|nr:unnamed protein product [Ostreobium quekettii]